MAFDGNGNWISNFSAVADRDANIKILASRFDNIFISDIATSFENCLTKDGQVKTQTNFNANNYRVINVADPVNDKDALNLQTLKAIYPVGSIYIGTQNSCPLASIISGSTWTLVSSGCALWTGNGTSGSGTTANADYADAPANTTIGAGLPDHTHTYQTASSKNGAPDGGGDSGGYNYWRYGSANATSSNASGSEPIYGKSSTVQPPAYVVNVWRRTA